MKNLVSKSTLGALVNTSLASCADVSGGIICDYPDGSYPDGAWEHVASLSYTRTKFLGAEIASELRLVISDNEKDVFQASWNVKIDPADARDLACTWDSRDRLSFSAEPKNAAHSTGLPVVVEVLWDGGTWVLHVDGRSE